MLGRRGRLRAAPSLLFVTLAGCTQGGLQPAGEEAERVLTITWVLTLVGAAVSVVVLVLLWWAVRRRGHDDVEGLRPEHVGDLPIERRFVLAGGLVLPAVVLAGSFVVHLVSTAAQATGGAMEVEVVGHRYWWEVRYHDLPGADGPVESANEVRVPVGTEVTVTLRSDDVIHSFWVPQIAGKMDLVPGRTNDFTFVAEEAGTFEGYCAEFCGLQHAWMKFEVVAMPSAEFDSWARAASAPAAEPATDLEARGRDVFTGGSCAGCHAVRGVTADDPLPELGPDLTHLASRNEIGAGILPLERDALTAWVVNPQAIKPGAPMPPADLSDDDLDALVAYLLSLE